ncbi:DUF4126 domain-containing protein [Demequina sp. B12]|uniref:DUF4126 domain-containing protein n=1 Tax=Demequina sp. B12 TaxID=2992757 RepID=UPI00237AA643|nr:DUF4126 domain-containing protein [Demequina sp. B12]MDE0573543.1 DUF4126 domain-containing protein [Demequina sp. B12]
MLAALTGAGLSAAAGLNAFIPLLIVGLFARFTDFIVLPEHLLWLESWPVIIVSLALLSLELILDKIPGVDHINDLLQTLVRPVVGGVIFAATAAAQVVDQSNFWQENPLVAGIVGALVSLAVHLGKASSRPAVNATTGGTGAPLASFAEDAIAVVLSLVAIFVPILVVVVFIFMGITVYRIVTTGRRRRRHREMLQAQERLEREAEEAEGGMVAWWRSKWREPSLLGKSRSDSVSPRHARRTSRGSAASGSASSRSAASAATPGSIPRPRSIPSTPSAPSTHTPPSAPSAR